MNWSKTSSGFLQLSKLCNLPASQEVHLILTKIETSDVLIFTCLTESFKTETLYKAQCPSKWVALSWLNPSQWKIAGFEKTHRNRCFSYLAEARFSWLPCKSWDNWSMALLRRSGLSKWHFIQHLESCMAGTHSAFQGSLTSSFGLLGTGWVFFIQTAWDGKVSDFVYNLE